MDQNEFDVMYRVEDTLWWYRGMQHITRALISRYIGPTVTKLHILDAGCGTGAGITWLSEYGEVSGLDFSALALAFCQQRGLRRIARASIVQVPFPTAMFDLLTSFDVILMLSLADCQRALHEFARVLRPGGTAIIRVAAYDWLRGSHDAHWDVQHRYTTNELSRMLAQAGFQVDLATYANMWLFPIAAAKRLSERILPIKTESDSAINLGRLNRLFTRVLSSEATLMGWGKLPFGLSVMAVARKR